LWDISELWKSVIRIGLCDMRCKMDMSAALFALQMKNFREWPLDWTLEDSIEEKC